MIVASLNDYWKQLKLDLLFAPDTTKQPELLRISSEPQYDNEDTEPIAIVESGSDTNPETEAKSEGE